MEKFSYEEATDRISDILSILESGNVNLNDSYELFIEAKELIEKCKQYLDKCEKEFELIVVDEIEEDDEFEE